MCSNKYICPICGMYVADGGLYHMGCKPPLVDPTKLPLQWCNLCGNNVALCTCHKEKKY